LQVAKQTEELERLGPEHDKYRQISQALDESKSMLLDAKTRVTQAKEMLESFWDEMVVPEEHEIRKEGETYLSQALDV